MSSDDAYGTGPAMHALADLKAFNKLPADERRAAIRYAMLQEMRWRAISDVLEQASTDRQRYEQMCRAIDAAMISS